MRKTELIDLVEKAMGKCENFVDSTQLETNPQVVDMCNKARGRHDALYGVLEALKGNSVFLRIDAGL